jgi:hypothetical protein
MEENENEIVPIGMVESMTRGEINSQVETAHRHPRSLEKFKKMAIGMACIDEETAASCIYRRPVGKENGVMKYAEGMSIRMAEIVGAAYGNLRVYSMLIDQTERQVVARGMAMDLESNFASSSEVVESTVNSDGKPYSERMRTVTAKATLAKARRDATFQVVPRALARPIEAAVRKLLLGETKSVQKRRAVVLTWIEGLEDKSAPNGKVDPVRVWKALGIAGPDDLGIEQIETLTGLRTAIKDGETTVSEAFPLERFANAPTPHPEAQLEKWSIKLGKAILDFTNNDGPAATDILQQICGKTMQDLQKDEAAAKAAFLNFENKYQSAGVSK